MTVHLNIGSNTGDRHALIERAVALLVETLAPSAWRVSTPVESAPWGYQSENPFLNIGIDLELATPLQPEALLDITQSIERCISAMPHRNPDGTYRDREIDIDIILIDDLVIDTPRLRIPHPHAKNRPFVMIPL
ncbi:MAG: 2-amino-4-hydroxy-6-hydroxymethyldihydropteridine diphosphokinase, partial [Muribaculaceae bacterium]|nr:2-amino-4-hydroxy-6-hydroxymethyldihydropteridine diphosphokinase [Muribaculaceae bacterium]MDE6332927.1 2-amino-4-hydroxy-6-hydroxymethyldihydropteridine diphosphokinase [Muribaculaceae bacterium]